MISPEEFALLNQNAERFYASQARMAPKKKTKNVGGARGSSPTAFISEAGGMGGALAGAAAGTAIMPGVGTLLGAGIGGLVGGFGGKLAEDKIRDDEWDFKDAGIEGAISGVMGAGPLRGAKAIGGAVKAGVKDATLDDALLAAGEKYAGKGMTSGVGDQLGKASDAFRVKSFRLSPSQITNYSEKHGEDVIETMKQYGIKKPEDIDLKGIVPRQAGYDEAVSALGTIPKKDVINSLKATYEPLLKSAVHDDIATGRALKAQATTIAQKFGNEIPAQEVNALKKQFDNVVGYTDKRMNPGDYNVNKHAADALRDVLNDRGDRLHLRNSQGMSVRDLGLELSKLYQMRKIAQKQLGLGRGAQTIRLTDMLGAGAGAAAGGPVGAMGAAAGTHAINSPSGTRALSSIAGGLGKAGQAVGGALDSFGTTPLGAGARVGAANAFIGAGNGMSAPPESSLEDAMLTASDGGYDQSAGYSTPSAAQSQYPMAASSTVEQNPYSKQSMIADIQRDPTNAKDYIALYKELADIYAPPEASTKGKNSTASGVIADTRTGLNALSELSGSIDENGANFPGIGFLRSKNPFDSGAQQLQAEIATARQIVGKALEGGVLRKEDEAKYKKILPTINDTDATAQYKLHYLQQLISARLQEYEANLQGGGGGDLADYLYEMQQQPAAY